MDNGRKVDVICQHTQDGSVIPLRVRFTDDDGQSQTFNIKEYNDLSHRGTRTMQNGVYVTDATLVFECHIVVFNNLRTITLYYEPLHTSWIMTT